MPGNASDQEIRDWMGQRGQSNWQPYDPTERDGPGLLGLGFGPDFGPDIGGAGSRLAAERTQNAINRASQSTRQGMDNALAAQMWGFGQAQGALNPYMQRGLGYMDSYANMAMNPNLDSIRRERQDATDNLNAQLSGMGIHNSGFNGRQQALLQSDYASRMYDARIRAMQPLLGVGPGAASSLAGAAGQLGKSQADTYQSGANAVAGLSMQAGQTGAQSAMAPGQNFMNYLPLILAAYGMSGGGGAAAGGSGGMFSGLAAGGYTSGAGGSAWLA